MILALLLAVQAAPPDVIVTGRRLEVMHERCARGGCGPLRDAQVSIAWAEAQFRDGLYVAAKRTLAAAASRNKRHAAAHPRPVAAIYEAYATVSWQEGDQDTFRRAVANQVRTLRDNLPADDDHVRGAALAYGDMWLRLGQPREAERAYAEAAREARAGGRSDVALRALIAGAQVRELLGDRKGASALLVSAEAMSPPGATAMGGVIAAMRARFAAADTEGKSADRLAATLRDAGFSRPVLIWAPPYPLTPLDAAQAARTRAQGSAITPGELFADVGQESNDLDIVQWADIGYRIRPDGRTAEIEVVRGSRDRAWTAPYLAQVAGRRYSVTPGASDTPGFHRVERFTLRANYITPKGSFIRRRAGPGKLEIVDLTERSAAVAAE